MIYRITSRTNLKVKDLLKNRGDYFIFEGEKLVRDILERNIEISKLIVDARKEGCLDITARPVQETWYVHETVLEKISFLKEKPDFIAALKIKKRKINFKRARVVIALDNVQDPGNAGTVFRCAAAFGIDAVALTGAGVDPANSRFLRAAQTAFFEVEFQEFADIETLIKRGGVQDYNIYITSGRGSGNIVGIDEVRFPCLIMFGNEGRGLDNDLFTRFPLLHIPQGKGVESLNVGVSACIIMYELSKSGRRKPRP